jgi:AraC-like DNA-binding protein
MVEGVHQAMEMDDDTVRLRLRFFDRPDHRAEVEIMSDFTAAVIVRRMRDVLGEQAVTLASVSFFRAPPASVAAHGSYFRAPVFFARSGDTDEIAFPRSLLAAPLVTADPALAQVLAGGSLSRAAAAAAASADRERDRDAFLTRVRSAIAASLSDGESSLALDVIAGALDLSGRALQRKLKERGVSLSFLIDEARRELAEELLGQNTVLLCDVAYRLGFADVRTFYRVFRRWTGTSPRAFQKARTGAT